MYEYENIDIPDFMKNKNKEKQIFTREEHEEEIEKAFIKGGLSAIGCMFVLAIIFIFIAVIEMI